MPGKKRDPNSIVVVPEDVYNRVRKLCDAKIQTKPPKGELDAEAWSIPPINHTMPELKQNIQYWKQCAIVQYHERKDLKTPTLKKQFESNLDVANPARRTFKECTELFKFMKTTVKQAEKRTGQFLKQLAKKEKKEDKRIALVKQIENFEKLMAEETRKACDFAKQQNLFEGMFPPDPKELEKAQALADAEKEKKSSSKMSTVHPAPAEGEEKPAEEAKEEEKKEEPPVNTEAEDLLQIDKMLKTITGYKKKIATLNKKLDKMEDLSGQCNEDRKNLLVQLALQFMLSEDKEIIDYAMNNTQPPPMPDV
jgi:hypothetical protein